MTTPSKTMTAEERAEKVYQGWCEIDTEGPQLHRRMVEDIATQIKLAVKEERKWNMRNIDETNDLLKERDKQLAEAYDKGFRAGELAMRERAAKVLEDDANTSPTTGYQTTCEMNAKSIRSLAPSSPKGDK